ncbi:LysR family transcriptional regulator [uncultured Pseudokineococcus sp.]|uniref:LysR family transcriptional regulator n=1 Tax=uncultured Pseudokineococcus sp. TaxID=1642928 RepID=UPI00262DCAAA|nr:LysR family transcriptional regulator [uncultured Pseudokineococcus sp.]
MQLQQLACFVAVVDERHFTRAAQRLHLAQPSLSAQVRGLEREVGGPLLHRQRGAVRPTEAGERLLPYARRILADAEAAAAEMRRVRGLETGVLRVGATPSAGTALLPPVLRRFHDAHPGVLLRLAEAGSRDLVEQLAVGALDLAVVVLPVAAHGGALATTPLLRDALVLASAAGSPAPVPGPSAGPEDLAEVGLVLPGEGYDLRATALAACAAAGVEPRVVADGGELDVVVALVRAGVGAAVLPRTVVDGAGGALRWTPLRGPSLHRTVGVAHRKDVPLGRAAAEVRRLLIEQTS